MVVEGGTAPEPEGPEALEAAPAWQQREQPAASERSGGSRRSRRSQPPSRRETVQTGGLVKRRARATWPAIHLACSSGDAASGLPTTAWSVSAVTCQWLTRPPPPADIPPTEALEPELPSGDLQLEGEGWEGEEQGEEAPPKVPPEEELPPAEGQAGAEQEWEGGLDLQLEEEEEEEGGEAEEEEVGLPSGTAETAFERGAACSWRLSEQRDPGSRAALLRAAC